MVYKIDGKTGLVILTETEAEAKAKAEAEIKSLEDKAEHTFKLSLAASERGDAFTAARLLREAIEAETEAKERRSSQG